MRILSKKAVRAISAVILSLVILPFAAGAQVASPPANTYRGATGEVPGQELSQQPYTVLAPLPCIPTPAGKDASGQDIPAVVCPKGDLKNVTEVNFQQYVQYTFNLLIAGSAVAAVFMLVLGGLQYMTTDSFTGKSAGKERAQNAVKGLILVLCSYLILRTIDPRLVAIPSTLVQPLRLETVGNRASSDFFTELSKEADAYQTLTAERRAQIAAAKAKAEALTNEINDLEKQRQKAVADHNDTLAAQIQSQQEGKVQEIKDIAADQAYIEAMAQMSKNVSEGLQLEFKRDMNRLSAINMVKRIETKLNLIEHAYGIADARLKALGGSPETKAKLDQEHLFGRDQIYLILNDYTAGLADEPKEDAKTMQTRLDTVRHDIIGFPPNSEKRNSLETQYNLSVKVLQNFKTKYGIK